MLLVFVNGSQRICRRLRSVFYFWFGIGSGSIRFWSGFDPLSVRFWFVFDSDWFASVSRFNAKTQGRGDARTPRISRSFSRRRSRLFFRCQRSNFDAWSDEVAVEECVRSTPLDVFCGETGFQARKLICSQRREEQSRSGILQSHSNEILNGESNMACSCARP